MALVPSLSVHQNDEGCMLTHLPSLLSHEVANFNWCLGASWKPCCIFLGRAHGGCNSIVGDLVPSLHYNHNIRECIFYMLMKYYLIYYLFHQMIFYLFLLKYNKSARTRSLTFRHFNLNYWRLSFFSNDCFDF